MMTKGILEIEGREIVISNPLKVLWPKLGIRKVDYIKALIELSPYMIPHTINKPLMVIRYPDGINEQSFYQRNTNAYTPKWVDRIGSDESSINLCNEATLMWLGNLAALEFHTGFKRVDEQYVPHLVFDLDPSETQNFDHVREAALLIYEEMEKFNLISYIKTSGASGLQIFIPIDRKYSYKEAREANTVFAKYFAQKYPHIFSIERQVDKRGRLLYFDFLQMWQGKTIISVYSPRAVESAAVSTPVTWGEVEQRFLPSDFNLLNIQQRLKEKGDLFEDLLDYSITQNIDWIFNL